MAKIPKLKKIKRATVLIKRTRCIKNIKNKTFTPIYQKLKQNNHSLARALSQEKQDSQILFSKNVQLLSEVQNLAVACHNRDIVMSNILKNAKDMMQMLVTMSGFLTSTISCCQDLVSNPNNTQCTSINNNFSPGNEDTKKRLSNKSPARGVVKPMVSGHTITKPTINLSRVNMQRPQNVNLSIIQEGSISPERNLNGTRRSNDHRHVKQNRPLRSSYRSNHEDEEILNRKPSNFSGNKGLSGRYSKCDSSRYSGSGFIGRLSMCNSDYSELAKSPRVALQDVSRYLSNNQTVNINSLLKKSFFQNNSTFGEDENCEYSSPEFLKNGLKMNVNENPCDNSESEEEKNDSTIKKLSCSKKPYQDQRFRNKSTDLMESDFIDPKEGPSWLLDSDNLDVSLSQELIFETNKFENFESRESYSSLKKNRRSSGCCHAPHLSDSFQKVPIKKTNLLNKPKTRKNKEELKNVIMESNRNREEDNENYKANLCQFITRRRGISSRVNSARSNFQGDDNNDDDDETMMMNIKNQLRPLQLDQKPEILQFDMNELLQLTPLRPLFKIQNNERPQLEPDIEPTATVQITQRVRTSPDISKVHYEVSNIAANQGDIALVYENRNFIENGQPKNANESHIRGFSSKIELPRITDVQESICDNQNQFKGLITQENEQICNKDKSKIIKIQRKTENHSGIDFKKYSVKIKKRRQRKEKLDEKDPSSAKVLLQKLNDTHHFSKSNEASNGMKNSEEIIYSMKNLAHSGIDQSSDSENSTTSSNSRQLSIRPRRQKAPRNLQEPSLNKKLRRVC